MDGSEEGEAASPRSPPPSLFPSSLCRKRRRGGGVALQCPHCSKVIPGARTHYRRHLLTHTKERPHRCEFCRAGFTTNANRRRHVMRLHPELIVTWATAATGDDANNSTENCSNVVAATEEVATASLDALGFPCRFCKTEFSCKGSRTLHERRCSSRPCPPRVLCTTTASPAEPQTTILTSTGVVPYEKQQTNDPADTVYLCPNCEQELSSRQQLRRHLKCYCPFREDVFATSSDIDDDYYGNNNGMDDDMQFGPRSRTKRSRRILSKRSAESLGRSSGRLRHEVVDPSASAKIHASTSSPTVEVMSALQPYAQGAATVICPYDDCMSTFPSRTRWLAHVARRHPAELIQKK